MEASEQSQFSPETKKESNLGLKGIVEVFYQPAAYFEKLKDNPPIFVPWIILFLLVFTSIFLVVDLMVQLQMDAMQKILETRGLDPADAPTPAEVRQQLMIAAPLVLMLVPLIAAALALFFGNVVMEGRAKFKQLLSVMLYSEIVFALGSLMLAPLMLAKGSMKVSISLAAILQDSQVQDPLYVALSKFGAFYIWEIIVIGIGLSTIYGFSRNKGYTLAVLSMGMISIMHALTQLAFG